MLSMRSATTIMATCVSLLCSCVYSPVSVDSIDAQLQHGVEEGRVPGVIAFAADRDGITYKGAFGLKDTVSGEKITVDSIVAIASMTKPITSLAAMQLVEQGKLELDRPAGDYVPELQELQILSGFREDGSPILRPPEKAVTVRQLLTHTSGFAYELWNEDILRYSQLGQLVSVTEPGSAFLAAPLVFEPGTAWEYGIGADWIGVLIEAITGQTLDDYFREHIFLPLEMLDTHFHLPDAKRDRLASIHTRLDDRSFRSIPHSPPDPFFSGGGGLVSTADDYVRFMRAFLNDGVLEDARILKKDTVELMAMNNIAELSIGASRTVMPELSNDFDLASGGSAKFGLGFLINEEPILGGRSAGSLAWAGVFNTYFWIDRRKGVCGVFMTQILPFYDADAVELFEQFERSIYDLLDIGEATSRK